MSKLYTAEQVNTQRRTHALTPGDLCGALCCFWAAAICNWNEFFWLVSSGINLSLSFVCGCSAGFVGSPTAPPTTTSGECWFLIISPVVICHVDQPAARCMCAVWDLNGDGGSAGPLEENYKAHSEHWFIQSAGTLFASERLFLFVFGGGCLNLVCFRLSVSHLREE